MYIVGLFLMILTCIVTGQEGKYCLAEDNHPYLYFGIKTSYQQVRGTLNVFQECEPTQLYVVARHGTKYPGKLLFLGMKKLSQIRDDIVTNYENKFGDLCPKDLENFKKWQLSQNLEADNAHRLALQGETDMRELAKRLKAAFPTLFSKTFISNMDNYEFASDNTSSTSRSMLVFAKELFTTATEVKPKEVTGLLQTFKNCSAWEREKNTTNYHDEFNKFINGQEMQDVLIKVNRRLGFKGSLERKDMNLIYQICRLEKALNINEISAWCAAFTKEDLEVFEYMDDLYYGYSTEPGHSTNAKLGCLLMKDLFHHFRKLEGSDLSPKPKGIFYFVQIKVLNQLLGALGFKNDKKPVLASNFKESKGNLWRTSLINSFATNLVAVFYRCDDHSNKVTFHWAEKVVELKECDHGVCDWKNIRDTLGKIGEECNMDFCNENNGLSRSISNFNIIIFLLFLLVGFNKTFI